MVLVWFEMSFGRGKRKVVRIKRLLTKTHFLLGIFFFFFPQIRTFQLTIYILLALIFSLYFNASTPVKRRCGFLCNPEWTSGRKVIPLAFLTARTWGFWKGKKSPLWAERWPYGAGTLFKFPSFKKKVDKISRDTVWNPWAKVCTCDLYWSCFGV